MLFQNAPSIIPGDFSLKLEVGSGQGSTNTYIRTFTNTISNTIGDYATYATNATDGMSVTIIQSGWYFVAYSDLRIENDIAFGISVNSNQLSTSIVSITSANRLVSSDTPGANLCNSVSVLKYFSANDVIRAHNNGAGNSGSSVKVWFYMAKVA